MTELRGAIANVANKEFGGFARPAPKVDARGVIIRDNEAPKSKIGRSASSNMKPMPTPKVVVEDDDDTEEDDAISKAVASATPGGISERDMELYIDAATTMQREYILERLAKKAGSVAEVMGQLEAVAWRVDEKGAQESYNRFKIGLKPASILEIGETETPLWLCIFNATLNLINGQSGAGKTSIVMNMMFCLAYGIPCFGIPTDGRKHRILHLDPENPKARAARMERIANFHGLPKPDSYYFHDSEEVDLADKTGRTLKELIAFIQEYNIDILVIDPLLNLFDTLNENDNAEAGRQGKMLIKLIKKTNVTVVCVHHMGKSNDSNSARGASSREGIMRSIINLSVASEEGKTDDSWKMDALKLRDDAVRLQVTKNGIGGAKGSLYLKMQGGTSASMQDCFVPTTWNEWIEACADANEKNGTSKEDQAAMYVKEFMSDKYRVVARQEIIDGIMKLGPRSPGTSSIGNAIVKLCEGDHPFLKEIKLPGKGGKKGYHIASLDPSQLQDSTGAIADTADDESQLLVDFNAGNE